MPSRNKNDERKENEGLRNDPSRGEGDWIAQLKSPSLFPEEEEKEEGEEATDGDAPPELEELDENRLRKFSTTNVHEAALLLTMGHLVRKVSATNPPRITFNTPRRKIKPILKRYHKRDYFIDAKSLLEAHSAVYRLTRAHRQLPKLRKQQ